MIHRICLCIVLSLIKRQVTEDHTAFTRQKGFQMAREATAMRAIERCAQSWRTFPITGRQPLAPLPKCSGLRLGAIHQHQNRLFWTTMVKFREAESRKIMTHNRVHEISSLISRGCELTKHILILWKLLHFTKKLAVPPKTYSANGSRAGGSNQGLLLWTWSLRNSTPKDETSEMLSLIRYHTLVDEALGTVLTQQRNIIHSSTRTGNFG